MKVAPEYLSRGRRDAGHEQGDRQCDCAEEGSATQKIRHSLCRRRCSSARLQVVVAVLCDPKASPALARHKRRPPAKPARSASSTTPGRTPVLRLKTKSLCESPSGKRARSLPASQKGLHTLSRRPAGAGSLQRTRPPAYKKASSRHSRPSAIRSTRSRTR